MTVADPGTSAVRAAIAVAARQLGREDPTVLARDLLEVDVDALEEWFTVAAKVRVQLWQGADLLSDSLPMLSAGWSSPAPQLQITGQRDAGRVSREIIGRQVDAADRAASTLRHCRFLAEGELGQTDSAVTGLGWPPGTDLLLWAADNGQLAAVSAIVVGLVDRLVELGDRSNAALQDLAVALHSDPRDPVEVHTLGSVAPGGQPGSTGPDAATSTGVEEGVDRANLTRLEADLRSADAATIGMALGVLSALEKARREGGQAQLLVYESANSGSQGRAAIGIGDIASADTIAVMAPGISNSPGGIAGGVHDALVLRTATAQQAPGDSTAVVAWFGYDIPLSGMTGVPVNPMATAANVVAMFSDENALAGGALLTQDLAVMRQWAPGSARFVGIGFSMGATVISAAAALGADFDDVVLMGSPGASTAVQSADDYPVVPAEHTFVASFDQDPVTGSGVDLIAGLVTGLTPLSGKGLGPDPAAADFHAQVIDVDSNAPDLPEAPTGGLLPFAPGEILNAVVHHSEANYLDGASLDAIAALTVGRYSEVPIKPGR